MEYFFNNCTDLTLNFGSMKKETPVIDIFDTLCAILSNFWEIQSAHAVDRIKEKWIDVWHTIFFQFSMMHTQLYDWKLEMECKHKKKNGFVLMKSEIFIETEICVSHLLGNHFQDAIICSEAFSRK